MVLKFARFTFKTPKLPSSIDHKDLNGGTLGMQVYPKTRAEFSSRSDILYSGLLVLVWDVVLFLLRVA